MSLSLPEVQRRDERALSIQGLAPRSTVLTELVDWLRARSDVQHVRERSSGIVEVRCHDHRAAAVARSLEDHIYARHRGDSRLSFETAHSLPGRLRLRVGGISEDDLLRLASWVATLPGVLRATCSPATGSLLVIFDERVLPASRLLDTLRAASPEAWPPLPEKSRQRSAPAAITATISLALSATGLGPMPIAAATAAAAALPTLRRAAIALRDRRATVDLLDVSAVTLAIATGQVTTAALIVWLLNIGDVLLERSADRARSALSNLTSLDVPIAFRIEGNGPAERVVKVPAGKLRAKDRIVIAAGGRVPADGVVLSGRVWADEKALTGEADPAERGPASRLLAATTVVEGEAIVQVERTGSDTTAARVIRAIEGAGEKPMTLQREAERVTNRLVLPTFGLAGAAVAATAEMDRLISVLITDFGSGVRVALPTAALSSITAAARQGILVKGAQYLERLARTDVVVFDKTGTLTRGQPQVVEVRCERRFSEDELIALAAGVEMQSSHPAAGAVRRAAKARGVAPVAEVGSTRHVAGYGVAGRVGTRAVVVGSARWLVENGVSSVPEKTAAASTGSLLLVAVDRELAGAITLSDQPRPESKDVVRSLRARGRKVMLLSGDGEHVVRQVARAVDVDEAVGGLLPDEKAAFVQRLQRDGHVVAMIGDGINDAPALALADVGISLHGGTDVALETADVVLLRGGLSQLPVAFETAEGAMRAVRRGLSLVIAPNAVAIVLGALGLIAPGVAAIVNNGSTVVAALSGLAPLLEVRDGSASEQSGSRHQRDGGRRRRAAVPAAARR
ncbi:MAG TPA: heavy metal translocating P-type ATPase [Myxococcales bacterium]|nr:heavy metal translocating P-type ATPase [Myxococcales bacterium]